MSALLRKFIFEELVANQWLRRPKDQQSTVEDDPSIAVKKQSLHQQLMNATSVPLMLSAIRDSGVSINDIVNDRVALQQAIEKDDVDALRTCFLASLDSTDTTLLGHPMRMMKAGGTTAKRTSS